MTDKVHRIFLTHSQAIEAVIMDLGHYVPPPPLLEKLSRLVLSPQLKVVADRRAGHYWISISSKRWWTPMRNLNARQLQEQLVDTIRNMDHHDARLPEICSLVLDTRIHTEKSQTQGLWIETGIEDFRCCQCGQCCQSLDYHNQLTETDMKRWKDQGRSDILEWVAQLGRDGNPASYRIWVKKGTVGVSKQCPWLGLSQANGRYHCRIHETKPEICRSYPGSRKHALNTGCKGFEAC